MTPVCGGIAAGKALLLSRDPRAAAIVNEARGNLYLVASVRAAESDLQQLAQTP